ncbi:UNVERIFIED_CONTAM: hypothetical protein Sindi_3004100 [Sesamum indicum]
MAAGDEEDDGDASASDGDVEKVGGRRLVTDDGEDSYRERIGTDDWGDININCAWEKRRLGDGESGCYGAAFTRVCHTLGRGKKRPVSAPQLLGIDAPLDTEKAAASVQTAPFTGDFQANKSELMIGETSTLIAHGKRGGLEMEKAARAVSAPQLLGIDAPMDTEKEAASAPNLLGYAAPLEPQAVDETEQPRGRVYAENEKSPDETVEDEGLLRKEATIQASSLGFGEAPSSINGGRRFEPFNLEEFLRLANAVIDKGDEKTIAAIRDLKDRWKERFRSIPSLRSFVESRGAPSRVSKLRPALRCLLPSGMNSGESENALISSDSEKQSSAIGISAGNATVLPATGERRVPHLADVAIAGDGDGELAAAMADDVEGDVTDDAMMTSDDITADITSDDITAEITTDGITADAGMTASAVDVIDDVTRHKKTRKQFSNFSSSPTGLFVGNIPLHACSDTIINDKIAHAFHNSTRQDPILCGSNNAKRGEPPLVGYFLGKRPYFYHLKEFANVSMADLKEVTGTNNGFFFLQFKSVAAMEDVIEGGPWLFQGQPIVLQKMGNQGCTVASGVGKPLYPDAITRACTRLDFARVCVMLDVTSNLPKHIIIMTTGMRMEENHLAKVDVEYEWLPQKCQRCMTMGHS